MELHVMLEGAFGEIFEAGFYAGLAAAGVVLDEAEARARLVQAWQKESRTRRLETTQDSDNDATGL